jgi:hypothetical protein
MPVYFYVIFATFSAFYIIDQSEVTVWNGIVLNLKIYPSITAILVENLILLSLFFILF